jgi:hypothetical protein
VFLKTTFIFRINSCANILATLQKSKITKILFIITLCLFWANPFPIFAGNNPTIQDLSYSSERITVDGILDEMVWKQASKVSNFKNQFPFDTGFAKSRTEVMMAYDNLHLHIAAICYDDPSTQVVWNLRRDFALKTNDNFSVVIDPYLDGANGFNFAVTPLGTQREALILNGDQSFIIWDNKWTSKVTKYPDKWVVEMAIPFKTLRFNSGMEKWNFNFSRTDVSDNQISTLVRIPRNYPLTVLSFTTPYVWDKPIQKTGTNISIIPYAAVNSSKTKLPNELDSKTKFEVGGDAKIAITSSLNLDLTLNPDFSNVEVDRQVANLSRFEIFFPEQRQFFNENSDLFAQFGFSRIRPFFSRRIGLVANPDAPGLLPTRILYGARLSGKLNPNLRLGLLNVQTGDDGQLKAKGTNYTVATFQQKIFGRSNLAGIFVNKQVFKNDSGDISFKNNVFNRVIGLDYNLLSKDNRWTGKFFAHQSFENQKRTDEFAHAVYLNYNVPEFTLTWNHEIVGQGYNPELGYLQRPKGFFRIEPEAAYRYYPGNSKVNYFSLDLYNDTYWDQTRKVSDQLYRIQGLTIFKNTSSISLNFNRSYTRLYNGSFDPTNTRSKTRLDSNSEYWYNNVQFSFLTDSRKRLSAGASFQSGNYFNGWLNNADGSLSIRSGSWATWILSFTYNQFFFPEPFVNNEFWLVGPKAEISFSKSHFFTYFMQYNQQADNININARYQWRFAPVSDLFVVYSENYLPVTVGDLKTKNRALVIKLVYWFNV